MLLSRWFWIPAALLALVAVALCFVPLFHLLGYEFSLAIGLAAVVTGTIIGLAAGRRADRAAGALAHGWVASLGHLLLPLAIISLNALRVRNCDFCEGLWLFALLPLASSLYATTLGIAMARLLPRARWQRLLAIFALLAGSLLSSLWALYWQPPIFAYDHLWGYFAGSLYDEVIRAGASLLVFRLGTLLRIGLVALLVLAWDRRKALGSPRLVGLAALVLLTASLYESLLGQRFGFRVRRADIERALPVVEERPGIVIHLPQRLSAELRRSIADEHAFRLQQITDRLQAQVPHVIHSYVYPSAADKARWMGGHSTQITKPWLYEIHIHNPVSPHPVVAHELVHVVAASFAPGPLRISARFGVLPRMGLVEGLAEAVAPVKGEVDLDRWTRALRELGRAPDIRAILGASGFWTHAPRRAYTVAGSFVRYLLRSYGPQAVRQVYANGDFRAAFGKSLADLASAWEREIDAIDISARERRVAEERFLRPSIFARPCAHEIAELRRRAARANPQAAVGLQRTICDHLDDAPSCRANLALALGRANHHDAFLALADELLAGGALTDVQRSRLLEARGNLLWERGDESGAREAFQTVHDLELGAHSDRLQWVRLWALGRPPPLATQLRRFLSGKKNPLAAVLTLERAALADTHDATYPYLIARQVYRVGEFEEALAYLERAAGHPYPAIEAERLRLLADCQWQLKRYDEAEASYRAYAERAPSSGERARALDWVERIRWQRQQRRRTATDAPPTDVTSQGTSADEQSLR